MNPTRLAAFTEAYAPAVLAAAQAQAYHFGGSPEDYAVSTCLRMLEALRLYGWIGIAHYHINNEGGALARACATLGIPNTRAGIDSFLEVS